MAISSGGGGAGRQNFTEINITPLTDIFLVLLIIMMVIAPMFQEANQDINIPKITSGQSVEEGAVLLEVVKEGDFFLKGQPIKEQELVTALQEAGAAVEEKRLVVRADEAAKVTRDDSLDAATRLDLKS